MLDFLAKYWLEVFFSAVLGIVVKTQQSIISKRKKDKEEQDAIREGIKALLWDRLYCIYDECLKKGYISIDALRNVENLYQQYHSLGGNGTGTEMYEKLKDLPNLPPMH